MKLTIFNGSPRFKKSNSHILTEHFLRGFQSINANAEVKICYLSRTSQLNEHIEIFKQTTDAIIILPLYTDCMPGIVKEFFEHLPTGDGSNSKNLGFIVQSGFPEANHSIYLERYLAKLTKRLKYNYLGTIIKGGVEGIAVQPPFMTKELFKTFHKLGEHFAKANEFHQELVQKMRTPLKMSSVGKIFFRAMLLTGLPNYYWRSNLKKHGAYNQKDSRPYAP
jgi:NAD(P)H-dependent FMN reductase